jgi:peptide/nickel transport system substrate-binding protein
MPVVSAVFPGRFAARLSLVFLAIGILASCNSSMVRRGHVGDVLQAGAAIEPNSFNPLLNTESIEDDLDRLVFNGLTLMDEHNHIQPDLASVVPTMQNGGISKDGKTITYHLRKGVTWQDGERFTSADVKFTWQAIMNRNTRVGNRIPYDIVRDVDTPDAYTAVFHLKTPYAPFVPETFNSTTIQFIVPAHVLSRYSDLNQVPFNTAPVGTGPYRLAKWIHGDRIEFTANSRYFKGAPRIRTIVVRAIPAENTAINELRSGELDWFPYISEASYSILRGVPNVKVVVTPQNSYRALYINTARPIVSDVRIRQAIAYAIDKKQLVDKVTHGTGAVATEDIPSFMWAYDKAVPVFSYDPSRARKLLRQLGWQPGPDGILAKNGRPFSLLLVLRQGAAGDTSMAVMVQSWLRAIGIKTTIKTYPGSMLFALGPSGVLDPGKYDLDISGFASSADPDNSSQFTCANRPPNGFNWTRYCSPQMDRLQTQALTTYDQNARKAAYAKIETLLALDVPQVFIYYQPQISAINASLKNFKPSMVTPAWNVQEWSFVQ